jgi:hypothetical protein
VKDAVGAAGRTSLTFRYLSMMVGWLYVLSFWGCTPREPSPSVESRLACPGVTSALEAADHFKIAATALHERDVATAVAEARRADTAMARARVDAGAIQDGAATAELRGKLAKLAEGIGHGNALILDPALTLEGDTIDALSRVATSVSQQEGIVARLARTTTCSQP